MTRTVDHATLSHAVHILMTVLLCLAILLQILGVAVSFWDLNGSDDPFTISLLTGFAVLSSGSALSLLFRILRDLSIKESRYQHLRQYMLFHPPLSRS